MKPVTIYSTMMCPYCSAAKNLLPRKGVKYDEIDVTFAPGKRSDNTGELIEVGINVGDTVLYSKYGGTEVSNGGEDLLVLNSRDVLAIVG